MKEFTRRIFLRQISEAAISGYLALKYPPNISPEVGNLSEPNDYWFASQRLLFQKMHVLEAFAFEMDLQKAGKISLTDSPPVRLGFIDYSGITRIPGEFPPVPGWDAVHQNPIPDEGVYEYINPKYPFTHATQVASIAISRVDNGIGIAGLCGRIPVTTRQAKLYQDVIKPVTMEGLTAALNFFALPENRVDVLNISTAVSEDSPALASSVDYLVNEAKTVIVAAAGNINLDQVLYPAAYSNVLSVGAINFSDNQKWPLSNWGKIDIAAYGSDVPALFTREDKEPHFSFFGGTSAASAQISALAVHLKFFSRQFSITDILDIVRNTGTPVATPTYNWRLPNYEAAIRKVA